MIKNVICTKKKKKKETQIYLYIIKKIFYDHRVRLNKMHFSMRCMQSKFL